MVHRLSDEGLGERAATESGYPCLRVDEEVP